MNTIYILWQRQLIRFFRTKTRIIASLAQPVLFLVAFGFGLGPVFAAAGKGNYIQFLAPGIIGMTILFSSVFTGMEIIWDKQFGFLKETLVAPVSRFNIMLGRTLGGATVAFMQGVLVFFITMLVGFRPNFGGTIFAFVFMFLVALLFSAFGTAVASKLEDMQSFPLIINFVVMPIYFLSGAIFPVQGLNPILNWIIRFNPLAYGVDGIRGALIGAHTFSYLTDFSVMAIIALIIIAIGGYFFSKVEV
ncbi:TPA: multidrug ABC transporter permease [Candidatus Taylorbacteria bacterium]|nr:multidrug ABC transporter permease [Candidatus Taylorbacteria bacterium]